MIKLSACPVCSCTSLDSFISTSAMMHSSKERFNFDQCNDCQLTFLNPRVSLVELKNYYTSYYLPYRGSKAWGKFEHLVENSQKKLDIKRMNRVKKSHSISADSLILDIGCGQPSFLKTCQDKLNCQTMGIDFSNEGWKVNPENYKDIDLKVAEIKELSAEVKPDVITMWHYLEHDYTPVENLIHLKSISKPSTKLVIEIPNFDSDSRKKYGENWAGWHTPRHISLFSPNNVELLLNKSGWKVERIDTYGTMNPFLLYWMSEMEIQEIQWDKNMEEEFWKFLFKMGLFLPKKLFEKQSSLGVMTVIASPA